MSVINSVFKMSVILLQIELENRCSLLLKIPLLSGRFQSGCLLRFQSWICWRESQPLLLLDRAALQVLGRANGAVSAENVCGFLAWNSGRKTVCITEAGRRTVLVLILPQRSNCEFTCYFWRAAPQHDCPPNNKLFCFRRGGFRNGFYQW